MEKAGYSLEGHISNQMVEYKDIMFDVVITVCDHANEHCPYFKNNHNRIHHFFEDPAKAQGTDEEKKWFIKEYETKLLTIAPNSLWIYNIPNFTCKRSLRILTYYLNYPQQQV